MDRMIAVLVIAVTTIICVTVLAALGAIPVAAATGLIGGALGVVTPTEGRPRR